MNTGETRPRLSARLWPVARIAAGLLILVSISLFLFNLILTLRADPIRVEDLLPGPEWTVEETLSVLEDMGVSVRAAYIVQTVSLTLVSLAMIPVGLVIFARKKDWYGLLVGVVFVLVGAVGQPGFTPLLRVAPFLEPLTRVLASLAWAAFLVVLASFPDGRFIPAWTRWVALAWVFAQIPILVFPETAPILYLPYLLIAVGSQIYRYLRLSDVVQRQQTRWVLAAFAILALAFAWVVLSVLLMGETAPAGKTSVTTLFAQALVVNASLALLPITIAIGILRYRLWDLSVVVNRALVYGPLMTILAVVFAGSIALTSELAKQYLPESEAAPALISAIVVASVFQPIRSRLETWVDKRFYPERRDLTEGLVEIQPSFWPFRSVEQLMDACLDHVCQVLACRETAIYLGPEEGPFRPVRSRGSDLGGLTAIAPTKAQSARLSRKKAVSSVPPDRTSAYIPIYVDRHKEVLLLGVLSMGPRTDGRGYSGDELKGLAVLGGHLGLALYAVRPSAS